MLVDPAHSTTEAWTVTSGYDMVTGLGSVNVNNLATKWGTVSTVVTTTTLTLSPTAGITHGTNESVTVNIAVTPTSATGIVSLIAKFADGTTQGLDEFTLGANGGFSGTTKSLPGGTNYTVTAHYAGDGTNAPSDSAGVAVTVAPETSQTFLVVPSFDASGNLLNGNAASVPYGSNYIIRMYVTDKNAVASATGPPSGSCDQINLLTCPTGTVTLTDSGTLVGTGGGGTGIYNLNNAGYTRNLSPNLAGGTHTLVATYSGDNSYQSSTSTMYLLTVTPAATDLTAPYIPYSPETAGIPVSITSYVVNRVANGVLPTGTITFYDGTNAIPGTVSYASNPWVPSGDFGALISATFTTSGTHRLTAQYSGDANYLPETSLEWDATVFYPTTIGMTAIPPTVDFGNSVTVTAKVISSYTSTAMTGQIQFLANGSPVTGSPSTLGTDGNGNQVLMATLTTTPQGSEVIQANYQGDANFQGVSGQQYVYVNIPDFTLPDSAPVTVTAGQSQSTLVMVTPLSNTPSTVAFTAGTQLPLGVSLSFSPATADLNGSAVPVTITVTTTGPSGGPVAASKTQVRHTGILALKRWNWWSISVASALAMIFLLGIPGRRRRYRGAFLAGVLCLTSFAIGCGGGGGSGGGGGGGGGGAVPTSITLATSAAKMPSGVGSFTLTATVSSTKPITGTVNIFQGSVGVGGSGVAPPITVVNGRASATVTNYFAPGTYSFWAQYTGDTNNLPSQSTTDVQEVITGTAFASYVGQTGQLTHQGRITINLQ